MYQQVLPVLLKNVHIYHLIVEINEITLAVLIYSFLILFVSRYANPNNYHVLLHTFSLSYLLGNNHYLIYKCILSFPLFLHEIVLKFQMFLSNYGIRPMIHVAMFLTNSHDSPISPLLSLSLFLNLSPQRKDIF